MKRKMNEQIIKEKVKTAKKTLVFTRKCMAQDIDGLKKIFIDNNADIVEVIPIRSFRFKGCNEYFYRLQDEKLGEEARNLFAKNFNINLTKQEQ